MELMSGIELKALAAQLIGAKTFEPVDEHTLEQANKQGKSITVQQFGWNV